MFTENMGLKDRIRAAREANGFSRTELGELTGIPAKSIEKMEYGNMIPALDRLKAIAEKCDVSFIELTGESQQDTPETPAENSSQPTYQLLLSQLDQHRQNNFVGVTRASICLVDALSVELQSMEPDELIDIAIECGIGSDSLPDREELNEMITSDFSEAESQCDEIENRIIDTSVFGNDLYAMDMEPLHQLAEHINQEMNNLDIEYSGFMGMGWGTPEKFISNAREVFRTVVLTGRLEIPDKEKSENEE